MKSSLPPGASMWILLVLLSFCAAKSSAQDCPEGTTYGCYLLPCNYTVCTCIEDNSIYSQTCPEGQVLACRYDRHCMLECQCMSEQDLAAWFKRGHKCVSCGNDNGGGNGGNNGGNGNGNYGYNGHGHGGCYYCHVAGNSDQPSAEAVLEHVSPGDAPTSTIVGFTLDQPQVVRVTVFDLSGKLLAMAANEHFDSGYHEVVWSAIEPLTGIYLVHMEAGSYRETVKVAIIP